MPRRKPRHTAGALVTLAFAILLTACVPEGGDIPKTEGSEEASTTLDRGNPGESSENEEFEMPSAPGFTLSLETSDTDEATFATLRALIPASLRVAELQAVATSPTGARSAVLLITPPTGIRGYPWIADLYANEIEGGGPNASDDPAAVVEVETPAGTAVYIWTDGDRVIVASSGDSAVASEYLNAMAEIDRPNGVWTTGACLWLDQSEADGFGTLPWAPFPRDLVVSCDEPHHAEVIYSDVSGSDAPEYSADRISFDRGYVCDQAYNETIGPQSEHTPSLVTYAPDADEWDRGDRYLACVVRVPTASGEDQEFTGRIADLADIGYDPEVGACTTSSLKVTTLCTRPHVFQFVGSVTVDLTEYPDSDEEFDAFCVPLLDSLAVGDSDRVVVIAEEIPPWSFEQGTRTTRCFAAVRTGDAYANITGSFFDRWTVLSGEGIPA